VIGPNTVAIEDTALPEAAWALFPNPAGNEVTVELKELPGKDYSLTLTDATGRQVLRRALKTPVTVIDTRAFAAGSYQATLQDSRGRRSVKKIQVQR